MCAVAMPTIIQNTWNMATRTPLCDHRQKLVLTDGEVRCSADEWLKAHCVNQLEVLQSLQEEYATLWEQYEQLHDKSREIIATLQQERDQKIAECENLSLQILKVRHRGIEGVDKNNTEPNLSGLETVRGEYNKLVCSYTRLKLEYEAVLAGHQCQLEDMKKEQDLEVSSLLEKLKLTQHENDTVYNVHHIRRLQKLNSEEYTSYLMQFEQKVEVVTQELEKTQSEHRAKISEKEQVILEQSECLRNAQSQIRALEVKCSTLSRSLESAQDELTWCLEKQTTLQAAVEQARRENTRIVEGIEEEKAKQKVHISSVELKLSEEYQKLKESYDAMLNEKKEYSSQLELLNETIKEYEALIANKEVELDTQLQALRQSEWQKRVALERENTVLQEKLAAHEREMRILEEKRESQQTTLQDHVQEFSTKCMALEAEVTSLKAEQQHQNECSKQTEMELQILMEKNYKKKHQCLHSQYKRLLETKQQLENDCAKLQSTVCALELTVSDVNKEVAHLTEIHQQTLDIERQNLQDENAELLRRLNEEELQVKQLLNALEDEKKHSKKVCRHYKKKMMHLNESMELAKAKQVKVEEEKESIRKSLTLDTAKLKKQIYKLKQREGEFNILLQGDYCCSGGVVPGYSISKQGNGVLSFAGEDSPPVIAQPPSS